MVAGIVQHLLVKLIQIIKLISLKKLPIVQRLLFKLVFMTKQLLVSRLEIIALQVLRKTETMTLRQLFKVEMSMTLLQLVSPGIITVLLSIRIS